MKKNFLSNDQFSFPNWSIPIVLLATCLLAFGLFIPSMGYFQDDWNFVYYASTRGSTGLLEFFNYDGHPLASWSYILSFAALGYKPILWHIYSLVLRWLAVTVLWLALIKMWPERKREALTVALIFALYPPFTLQPQAVSYFEVWVSYLFLAVSFYFTIAAIREPEKFLRFTLIAILFKIGHTFTSEYTWGTELMRPVFIWFLISKEQYPTLFARLKRTIALYAPYLLIFLALVSWRGLFYQSPIIQRSQARGVMGLLDDPFGTLSNLIIKGIPDIVLALFSSWNKLVEADYYDFSRSLNILLALLSLVSAFLAVIFYMKVDKSNQENKDHPEWSQQALIIGVSGLVFGMLPSFAAGYFIFEKIAPWNTRFVIGSMFGAALILTVLLHTVITEQRTRIIAVAILVGLLVSWHERNNNDFRYSWEKQTSFYEQLLWRVPALQNGTALISNQEILPLMGDYPTAFAINSLYKAAPNKDGQIPYWFYALYETFPTPTEQDLLVNGTTLQAKRNSVTFAGSSQEMLVFTFTPEQNQCLWIFRPEYKNYNWLPAGMKYMAKVSNLERISEIPGYDVNLTQEILGSWENHTWCYFYEKADLARQFGHWETIVSLWEEAAKAGQQPGHGLEYLPFVEGYGRTGAWDQAAKLTIRSNRISPGMKSLLCPIWDSLIKEMPDSPIRDTAVNQVDEAIGCRR